MVINNLAKYSKYRITVQAFNNLGTGPKNVPEVVAMTDEDGEHANTIEQKVQIDVKSHLFLLAPSLALLHLPPACSCHGWLQMLIF